MEQYATINVQFNKQVVGVRRNFLSKTDSIRFVKDIEQLIASSRKIDSLQNIAHSGQKVREDSIATKAKLAKQ